jgi:hypothetical protein
VNVVGVVFLITASAVTVPEAVFLITESTTNESETVVTGSAQ